MSTSSNAGPAGCLGVLIAIFLIAVVVGAGLRIGLGL